MKARSKTVKGGKQKSQQKKPIQEEICTPPLNQQATLSKKYLLSPDDQKDDVDYEDDNDY